MNYLVIPISHLFISEINYNNKKMEPTCNKVYKKDTGCWEAAKENDFEELKRAFEQGCVLNGITISYAVEHNNYEMILWALENGCKKDSNAIMKASFMNNFNMVDFLFLHNFPVDELACSFAVSGGNVEMLKFLRSKNCPWDARTLCSAASKGRTDIIKWAHNHGCKYRDNPEICADAAASGKLECLEWLIKKAGYNCDRLAYEYAKTWNQDKVVAYLK
jgi:hypothetical protein